MGKTIEQKVADTLLQRAIKIKLGGVEYNVAPPSIATLVLVSEKIAEMPILDRCDESDVLKWSLKNAKDCEFVGDILATIILGAKGLTGVEKVSCKKFFGLFTYVKEVEVNYKKELSSTILRDHTPSELGKLTSLLLESMDIGSFFFTISFLQEVHLTKPTKKTEATAYMQQ